MGRKCVGENRVKGKIFVISAPSGAGKTTLCKKILSEFPDKFHYSVSATTRKKREGEVDGVDYRFVSIDEFKRMIDNDEFAEWAEVHGNYYGTPRSEIEDNISKGINVLLDIDVQGGMNIKKEYPEAVTIFIEPPSMKELERRLKVRGADDERTIKRRLENAKREMEYRSRYDHRVVNDNLDRAYSEIVGILSKYVNLK